MTSATTAAIERIPNRFLRTSRHPAAAAVPDAVAFDEVYEGAPTLPRVYRAIVDRLLEEAARHGEVLYAVPGSPVVAERTVELLRDASADGSIELDVMPALSFLELAWARLAIDPVAEGVRVVDGHRFAVEAAGERGPLLVGQCDSKMVLSEIKLAVDDPPQRPVVVLQRLGLPDEAVIEVMWSDLDRTVEPDHLTSVFVPELAAPVAVELARFDELVRTLRERCPWDREQTHRSLTRHLVEETYEVIEAIEGLPVTGSDEFAADDAAAVDHLEEELGDLLFQVYFHATLATEEGWFTLADVARGIHDKLVHRHPHVFGDIDATSAAEVVANWEEIKKAEKGRDSVMDGIPRGLPSLLYAAKVQRKAAALGFDWPDAAGPYGKVTEELAELQAEPSEDELGDLLFACVNVARHLGHDPEAALRAATAKFRTRFTAVERLAQERRVAMNPGNLVALDQLWDEVKAAQRPPPPPG